VKPTSSAVIAPSRTPEREQELAEQVLAIWREDMDRQAAAARERAQANPQNQIRRQAVQP
jgi:acetyl-CoA acetyltransferase